MPQSPIKTKILNSFEDDTTFGFNSLRKDPANAEFFEREPQWLRTVELFCFGECHHYREQAEGQYVKLSALALLKLSKLSLVSECLRSNTLTYDYLKERLGIRDSTNLEIFLAESIFHRVIDAVLFGEEGVVKVKSCIGRDVVLPGETIDAHYDTTSVEGLIEALHQFEQRVLTGVNYVDSISRELNTNTHGEAESSSMAAPATGSTRKRKINVDSK